MLEKRRVGDEVCRDVLEKCVVQNRVVWQNSAVEKRWGREVLETRFVEKDWREVF